MVYQNRRKEMKSKPCLFDWWVFTILTVRYMSINYWAEAYHHCHLARFRTGQAFASHIQNTRISLIAAHGTYTVDKTTATCEDK